MSEQVRGTIRDPFYVDEVLPVFMKFVKDNFTPARSVEGDQ